MSTTLFFCRVQIIRLATAGLYLKVTHTSDDFGVGWSGLPAANERWLLRWAKHLLWSGSYWEYITEEQMTALKPIRSFTLLGNRTVKHECFCNVYRSIIQRERITAKYLRTAKHKHFATKKKMATRLCMWFDWWTDVLPMVTSRLNCFHLFYISMSNKQC